MKGLLLLTNVLLCFVGCTLGRQICEQFATDYTYCDDGYSCCYNNRFCCLNDDDGKSNGVTVLVIEEKGVSGAVIAAIVISSVVLVIIVAVLIAYICKRCNKKKIAAARATRVVYVNQAGRVISVQEMDGRDNPPSYSEGDAAGFSMQHYGDQKKERSGANDFDMPPAYASIPPQSVVTPSRRLDMPPQIVGTPLQGLGMPPQSVGTPPQRLGMPPQSAGMPPQYTPISD